MSSNKLCKLSVKLFQVHRLVKTSKNDFGKSANRVKVTLLPGYKVTNQSRLSDLPQKV